MTNSRSSYTANQQLAKGANNCPFQASINAHIRANKGQQPKATGNFNDSKTWDLV